MSIKYFHMLTLREILYKVRRFKQDYNDLFLALNIDFAYFLK